MQETNRGSAKLKTTRWSVVLEAGDLRSPKVKVALDTLCHAYWYPVYSFVRWRGHAPAEAKDFTQEFFSRLIESNSLRHANPDKGRFRSFLFAAVKNFLANEWDRAHCQKRGGNHRLFSLDECDPEDRYLLEPTDNSTPEKIFERKWARTLLERVLDQLEKDCTEAGKNSRFSELKNCLTDDSESHAAIASRLNMTPSAVKSAVHRLRQRYLELIREEIARTVETRSQVDEEIRHLFEALCD